MHSDARRRLRRRLVRQSCQFLGYKLTQTKKMLDPKLPTQMCSNDQKNISCYFPLKGVVQREKRFKRFTIFCVITKRSLRWRIVKLSAVFIDA